MFETAYPKLNPNPKKRDLEELFSPNHDEIMLAKRTCKSEGSLLGFLVTLKTFQRLGYFVYVRDVPPAITEHIVRALGFLFIPATLSTYDASGTRDVHLKAIRAHQQVAPFQSGGQAILERAAFEAAQSKEDLRDLINACIEQIVRQRFTLPGLSTIRKTVQRIRAEVNDQLFQVVFNALTLEDRTKLEGLLARRIAGPDEREGSTGWARVKQNPGKPSLQHFKLLLEHRAWLLERQPKLRVSTLLPNAKFQQFAAEADSLDAARMRGLEPFKRATLTAVLLEVKAAKVLDDLGEVFVKRMMHIHRLAKEALARHQLERQARTDALVQTLKDVLVAYNTPGSVGQRLGEIDKVVRDRAEQLINECEQHAALSGQNYFPFLWRYYSNHRATLFKLLGLLDLRSTTQDSSLLHAIAFIVAAEGKRAEWLGLEPSPETLPAQTPAPVPAPLNLEWLSDRWWTLVTGQTRREAPITQINRKQFEVCVFTRLLWDLKSGDLSIHGSLEFADYRTQLVNDSEFDAMLAEFCEQVGLPADPQTLIAQARSTLEGHARTADAAFPNNIGVRLESGKLVLKAVQATPVPKRFVWLERQLESRLGLHPILDVLADTENLLGWSRFFGPISGLEAKLDRAQDKYLITTFSYGCNLGPTETARAVEGVNRQQLQWVNTRHVTEEDLENATNLVINAYNRFGLPKFWGSGKTVSADGLKWDVYQENLLAEYHVRYGGYGGIGYYHVSDTYIALFSRFVPCGMYEAVFILDGLMENKSDIQPDTVHSDTHGQSEAVFGLSFTLGVDLMPRIRDWHDLIFYRPVKGVKYAHIDELFTETIDWTLIETHAKDLLRIAISIKVGRVSASTILKRLSGYSRKNQTYLAFRELGRAVRTGFLLRYVTDLELRSSIQAAMNKSEQFNKFIKWVAFGAQTLASNDRDQQQKLIKYSHLIANCLIYHSVLEYTRVIKDLIAEGHSVGEELLERLSPYRTEHINRRGKYRLDLSRVPPEPDYSFSFGQKVAVEVVVGGEDESR